MPSYDAHAPADIPMDQLVLLGPAFLLKGQAHAENDGVRSPHRHLGLALS